MLDGKSALSLAALLSTFVMSGTATAELDVRFVEGAPKDRFVFANAGDCAMGQATILLDLSGSAAGLIFDTTGSGAGVEVFQPLEIVAGAEQLVSPPVVKDGDTRAVLHLRGLAPGQSVAFTIDVDDTAGGREITVSGSEILGAFVVLTASTETRAGFDQSGRAVVPMPACSG
ncbi:MAG: aggregation factor core [Paracoccaceae bacterium]|nr:aggregation factor core [Paracoccaceae bacterium]